MKLTAAQEKAIDNLGFTPGPGAYRVGRHAMIVGDLEDPLVLDLVEQEGPWDLAWTDPPWNAGIAKTFRMQAGLEGAGDLNALFAALGSLLGWVKEAALVWVNEEQKARAVGALYEAGFERSCEFKVTYARFSHATPVTVGARKLSFEGLAIDGLHGGRSIAQEFLRWYGKPARLLDPFAGQDVLAHVASDRVRVTGVEIHPGRAAVTLARLAKIERKAPVRL